MTGEPNDIGVRSAQLALDVLEAVAFAREELGVTQIAERLGLPKGSVHRHLVTLVHRGYLMQSATSSRYALGAKCRLLAELAPERDLARVAQGPMRELRDRLGLTVVLSTRTPRGALVLCDLAGTSVIEIGVRPGSELAFHASAQGKVMLASCDDATRARLLARPLRAFTTATITDRATLESELARILVQGYASAPQQTMLGINALAAPIFEGTGACAGAVAIVGSIQQAPDPPAPETLSALRDCGRRISERMRR